MLSHFDDKDGLFGNNDLLPFNCFSIPMKAFRNRQQRFNLCMNALAPPMCEVAVLPILNLSSDVIKESFVLNYVK